MVPERLRVSIGTASVLELTECRLDEKPTTAYFMTYTDGGCMANCAFCPQARESRSSRALLSRVLWPDYPTMDVMGGLRKHDDVIERICIQAILYQGFFDDILALLRKIKDVTDLPVSLDTLPLNGEQMRELKEAGLERISIPLDAATPELFDEIKGRSTGGPYRWDGHMRALSTAVEIFGKGKVFSNLIVGLGETEKEAVGFIQRLTDGGILIVLYAFTPIEGTKFAGLPQPPLDTYRRIQLARHLITRGLTRFEAMVFDDGGRVDDFGLGDDALKSALFEGEAFQTCGCPGCNRPFYNERPSGPFYNYPRSLTKEEAQKESKLIGLK